MNPQQPKRFVTTRHATTRLACNRWMTRSMCSSISTSRASSRRDASSSSSRHRCGRRWQASVVPEQEVSIRVPARFWVEGVADLLGGDGVLQLDGLRQYLEALRRYLETLRLITCVNHPCNLLRNWHAQRQQQPIPTSRMETPVALTAGAPIQTLKRNSPRTVQQRWHC